MISRIKSFIFRQRYRRFLAINQTVEQQLWMQQVGQRTDPLRRLYDCGFSTFSQHEEDGILLYVFSLIGSANKKCLEMCAGTGMESNTANLLVNHFWHGLLFDGNKENVRLAELFYSHHRNTRIYPPVVAHSWLNRDNVNEQISAHGMSGEIDLLSLDIDGIDYYLFEAIEVVSPRVVILEINHLWGPDDSYSVPYDENFVAEFSAEGTDYAGASLAAFIKLARTKGYYFIGTNRFATNAVFLRNDIRHPLLPEVENCSIYFDHPRVKYGMSVRLDRVKDKEWVPI